MEEVDYSQFEDISLLESNLFSKQDSVFKHLDNYGIKNIAQLLQLENLTEIGKLQRRTLNQLRGIIELAKYKYLNIPFVEDIDFTSAFQKHDYDSDENIAGFYEWDGSLDRMGFTNQDIKKIYASIPLKDRVGMTVIEFLTTGIHTSITRSITLKTKCELYIALHADNKKIENPDETKEDETITYLRKHLHNLERTRDLLNTEIEVVQKIIKISPFKGMKK